MSTFLRELFQKDWKRIMFKTNLFTANSMTKTDSKIIKANDFMATRTGVTFKTIYDMRCHVRDITTEYYQELYSEALVNSGGREPKNVKSLLVNMRFYYYILSRSH